MSDDLTRMTAREAVRRLKAKDISPLDLIDAAARRIEQCEGALNALPTRCLDRARDHARALMRGDRREAEGEADVRRALLTRLKATGKYNLATSKFIGYLAQLLVEQGRFADAEKLTRTQVDIWMTEAKARHANVLLSFAYSVKKRQRSKAPSNKAYAKQIKAVRIEQSD